MAESRKRPIIYITGHEDENDKAIKMLQEAEIDFEVKDVPSYHPLVVASGSPVLFGLSNKFEGLEGVRIFIQNATYLGRKHSPA